jgi:hypothetical protein
MVSAENYKPLITQLYPRDDQWVTNDTVFAVKDDLLLDFKPSNDPKAKLARRQADWRASPGYRMCLMSRAGCKSIGLFCGVTCVYISYSEIYGKLRANEYLIECSLSQLDLW